MTGTFQASDDGDFNRLGAGPTGPRINGPGGESLDEIEQEVLRGERRLEEIKDELYDEEIEELSSDSARKICYEYKFDAKRPEIGRIMKDLALNRWRLFNNGEWPTGEDLNKILKDVERTVYGWVSKNPLVVAGVFVAAVLFASLYSFVVTSLKVALGVGLCIGVAALASTLLV